LDEEGPVDRLVGNMHLRHVWVRSLEPRSNLLRRQPLFEHPLDFAAEAGVLFEFSRLRALGTTVCIFVASDGAISAPSPVAPYLPAHRRSCPTERSGNSPDRQSGAETARDFFALLNRELPG